MCTIIKPGQLPKKLEKDFEVWKIMRDRETHYLSYHHQMIYNRGKLYTTELILNEEDDPLFPCYFSKEYYQKLYGKYRLDTLVEHGLVQTVSKGFHAYTNYEFATKRLDIIIENSFEDVALVSAIFPKGSMVYFDEDFGNYAVSNQIKF